MSARLTTFSASSLTRLALIVACLLLFAWISIRLAALVRLEDSDFFTFWLAGKMNWLGMNPHDPQDWAAGHRLFAAPNQANPTFLYPLPTAILLAPLGLLTLSQAFSALNFVSLVAIAASLVILLRVWARTSALAYLLPVFAAAALFRPVIITLFGGQLSGLFLLVLCAAAYAMERRSWFWAGFLLGLLALKPSIGAPFLLLAGLWLLFHKHWAALVGMASAGVSLFLLGFSRNIHWVSDFLSIGYNKFQETLGFSPTIWGVSSGICGFTYTCTVVLGGSLAALLVVASLLLLIQRRAPLAPPVALSLVTCVSLLVTPNLWPYDQALLILPTLAFVAYLIERKAPFLLSATLFLWLDLFAILLMVVTIQIEKEVWNGLVPVASLLLVAVSLVGNLRRQRLHSTAAL
jgi:hypothetical protein